MASRRIERLNELVRQEIADLITREIKDPRLQGVVSITAVRVTADLRYASVFVSVLGSGEERNGSLTALQSAAGFLRKQIAQRIPIRQVPELRFKLDTSIEQGERIKQILRDIDAEESVNTEGKAE